MTANDAQAIPPFIRANSRHSRRFARFAVVFLFRSRTGESVAAGAGGRDDGAPAAGVTCRFLCATGGTSVAPRRRQGRRDSLQSSRAVSPLAGTRAVFISV